MSHRTQITLEDAQYERLLDESRRTGHGLAELVRRAIDGTYGATSPDARRIALDLSFGVAVAFEEEGGASYVEGIRHGLGRRVSA